MLAACALSLALSPVLCPPPEPGLLDLLAEARSPFAHLEPLDDEPSADVRADAPSAQPEGEARDDRDSSPTTGQEIGEPWATLADCESGDWTAGGFVEGSARWDYGAPGGFAHDGYEQYEGGLNFHPGTWDTYRHDEPARAYQASPSEQVAVAERVLADQGWGAWPVCAVKIGLR